MQRIFGLMFAGAFAAAGLFCLAMAAYETWQGVRAVSWPTVPAQIRSLELKQFGRGEDESWKVLCQYEYRFANQVYQSETVTLSGISQSSRSASHPLFERLQADRSRNRAVTHVNPLRPSESAIDVTFRPGMIAFILLFCLTHGTVGLGLMGWLWFNHPPKQSGDRWLIVSQNQANRRCLWIVVGLHALVVALAAPVGLFCLIHGQLTALFLMVIAGISLTIVVYGWRWNVATKHRGGPLGIIQAGGKTDRVPIGELRFRQAAIASVDLESRWSISSPEAGQSVTKKVTSASIHASDVDHLGIVRFSLPHLPLATELGTSSDQATDQRVKLEVIGAVNGQPYEDSFKLNGQVLKTMAASETLIDTAKV